MPQDHSILKTSFALLQEKHEESIAMIAALGKDLVDCRSNYQVLLAQIQADRIVANEISSTLHTLSKVCALYPLHVLID